MARSLLLFLNKSISTVHLHSRHHQHCLPLSPSSRLVSLRTQSNQPDLSDLSTSSDSTTDPLLSKLEDAIHRIIVRRSAPDWLPFLPGSSYWVPPPKSQLYGVAQLVEKLANPLTPEQAMSTNTVRGWPSSDYFVKGASLDPVEADTKSTIVSQSEDDEG
ncbi:uncharacterized protein LOC123219481 [Mangifera indica]|uniref:uncharacterized protein LOC123219481 n=1 Tax=Mangifera indica TaxID=29780 RepID=UPI001CFB3696|nr:uncharacterized protein LOC123219481 [Mangifera indica]